MRARNPVAYLAGRTLALVALMAGLTSVLYGLVYVFRLLVLPALMRPILCDALAEELLRQGYCP